MNKYPFIKNFKSFEIIYFISQGIILFILIVLYNYFGGVRNEDINISDPKIIILGSLCMVLILMSIGAIIVTLVLPKKILKFIYNESILKHYLPNEITKDMLVDELYKREFKIYDFDNTKLGLKLVNEKTFFKEASCFYVFVILDEKVDEKRIIVENKKFVNIVDSYIEGKKVYSFSMIYPTFCFLGEHFSNETIEKCKKGSVLSVKYPYVQPFYIGYESESKSIYYTEAIEKIIDMGF